MDDLALAAALGADGLALHHAEGRALRLRDGAGAVALRADLRRRAGGAALALTGRALLGAVDRDGLLAAEGRLRKLDGKARADALAALRGVGIAPSAAAEAAAEEAAENVAEVAEVEAALAAVAALTRAVVRVDAREAELVILGLLLGVRENLVGLVDLLELLLGLLVTGVHVRVVFAGQLFICSFNLVLGRVLAHAENLIIISFLCHTGNLPSLGMCCAVLSGGFPPPQNAS